MVGDGVNERRRWPRQTSDRYRRRHGRGDRVGRRGPRIERPPGRVGIMRTFPGVLPEDAPEPGLGDRLQPDRHTDGGRRTVIRRHHALAGSRGRVHEPLDHHRGAERTAPAQGGPSPVRPVRDGWQLEQAHRGKMLSPWSSIGMTAIVTRTCATACMTGKSKRRLRICLIAFMSGAHTVSGEVRRTLFARCRTSGQYLRIVYTERRHGNTRLVRPISAMRMGAAERARYER